MMVLHCICGKTQEFNNRRTPLGRTVRNDAIVANGHECEVTYGWHVDALCEECWQKTLAKNTSDE
jgi:hypothetical protein